MLSGRQARRLGRAAGAAALRAPQGLTVVRYRAQPAAATIVRLASTAILAYLLARLLPGTSQPVLAPLTALLVVQVSVYQTLRSAVRRVTAVVVGVLLAVALSAWVGFTWWSLGLTIAIALVIGYALHLGDTILEVPISAMLILSVGTIRSAADTRIIETLVGAGAGLLAGLLWGRPQVQSAQEAIEDLCDKMAGLLERMAAGLRAGSVPDLVADWLARGRALSAEIRRVDAALRRAEESVRLNPRGAKLLSASHALHHQLETVELAAVIVRGLARSLADSARLADSNSPVRDREIQVRLAGTLEQLAGAMRTYGRLAQVHTRPERERLVTELPEQLARAQEKQNQLSEVMGIDPAVQPVGWPLRGEIVSHLDRLRKELEAGVPGGHRPHGRGRYWRRARQLGRRGARHSRESLPSRIPADARRAEPAGHRDPLPQLRAQEPGACRGDRHSTLRQLPPAAAMDRGRRPDQTFADAAGKATVPVLVDLWAPWCGPCRMVSSALAELATEMAGQIKRVKVNVDHSPELQRRFGVQSIPRLLVLRKGHEIARQVGAAPAPQLRDWLTGALGG